MLNIKREPKDSRFFCSLKFYGAVAPMVERKPEELGVSGSSPLSTTRISKEKGSLTCWQFASVAPMVELLPFKERVEGSSPPRCTLQSF